MLRGGLVLVSLYPGMGGQKMVRLILRGFVEGLADMVTVLLPAGKLPKSQLKTTCKTNTVRRHFIPKDGKSITFWPCGMVSYNQNDVKFKFCGRCGRYMS